MISTSAFIVAGLVFLIALALFFPPADEDIDDFQPLGKGPKPKKREPKRVPKLKRGKDK